MDGEDQSEGGQVVVSSLFNGEWKDRHCVVRDVQKGGVVKDRGLFRSVL